MPSQTVTVRYPAHYPIFRCIGPMCTDNCCHDWPIEIDRAHYQRYKAEKNEEILDLCRRYVHRIKKDATENRYAHLSLRDDGRCGFQNTDGGCKLIRLLGPESLSHTCALYPRRKVVFLPECWELSLSLSCQEAVRLGVLAPERVEFRNETVTMASSDPLAQIPPTGIGLNGQVTSPPAWGQALRDVCIGMMQMRQYPIRERLAAIFLLLQQLDRLPETHIPQGAIAFLRSVEQGAVTDFWAHYSQNRALPPSRFFLPLSHLAAGRQSGESRSLLRHLQSHMDREPDGSFIAGKRAAQMLAREIQKNGDPLLENRAVWVENYMVNYMFSSCFPLLYRKSGYSFSEHGLLLLQQYGMLRCLLSVPSQMAEEERFVGAFVHIARLSQHGDFPADLRKLCTSLNIADLSSSLDLLL